MKLITMTKRGKKLIIETDKFPENFTGIVEEYEFGDGVKEWYKDGKLHREDGPAIEYSNGDKIWYKNGKWHREDGPAIELNNGVKDWYLNNKQYTESEFLKLTKPNPSCNGKIVEIDGKKYKLTLV